MNDLIGVDKTKECVIAAATTLNGSVKKAIERVFIPYGDMTPPGVLLWRHTQTFLLREEIAKLGFDVEVVCLLECRDKKTGELIPVICAMQKSQDPKLPVEFVPFAMMSEGPYEQFDSRLGENGEILD